MWHPQNLVTHPGVGAPRDYGRDYTSAVEATLEPLKYILQGQAQNQQAQHENNQDTVAQQNSQSTAKRADAYLALEQARQQHFNTTDDARVALEQAQEQRAKQQAAAEAEVLPLKVALTRAQVAQYQADTLSKITTLNNQASDNLTLGNLFVKLHSLSNDDILNGKASDLFQGVEFKTAEGSARASSILNQVVDKGALGMQVKEKAAWDSPDYFSTFDLLKTDHKDPTTGQMIPAMSTTEAFAKVQGLFNQAHNKVTQDQQIEQNKQDIDNNSMASWRTWAQNAMGINSKSLDQYSDADTKRAVGQAEQLAQKGYGRFKDDPTGGAQYRMNYAPPAGNTPATPTVNPTDQFFKGVTPTQTPSNTPLNPNANTDPTQQPTNPALISPNIAPQTIILGQSPGTTPGTSSIDDQTLNTLGAIHDWRTNQLGALSGGDSGGQLASIENAEGVNNG